MLNLFKGDDITTICTVLFLGNLFQNIYVNEFDQKYTVLCDPNEDIFG